MKKILFLIFVLFYSSCSATTKEGYYKINHEKLTVKFDLNEAMLFCEGEVKVALYGVNFIEFELPNEAKIKNILINNKEADFDFNNGIVKVILEREQNEHLLNVNYSIKFSKAVNFKNLDFEDPASNLISHISEEGIFIGGNVIWYPKFSINSDKKEITFVSERGFEFITEGRRVDHQKSNNFIKSTWLVDNKIRNLPVLGGPYSVKFKDLNNLQIFVFSYAENIEHSQRYIDATENYLKFYSDLIGPYPYEKFAIVETYLPVGISYQTFTIISKDLIKLPFLIDTSLPHEILHSWFGNGVFVDYRRGNWSEGLVTYLADYLVKEKKTEKDAIGYLRKLTIDYSTIVKEGEDFSLRDFIGRYDLATRVIGYGKSAMFFNYLRYYMGDRAFFDALRKFYKDNLFKPVSWDELRTSFIEKGGEEIKVIFEQWVERVGIPDFEIKKANKIKKGNKWLVELSLSQKKPHYSLKLPINIYGKGGNLILSEVLLFDREYKSFIIELNKEPSDLIINENFYVLRRLSDEEIPATVNSLKSAKKVLIVQSSKHFNDNFIQRFTKTMGIKNFSVSNSENNDFDAIVLLGVNNRTTEKGIIVDRDFFEVNKVIYKDQGDVLFFVMKKNNKIYCIFQAFSDIEAENVAHRITHYGPFSYLVFKNGINVDKGLIESEKNRLYYRF
ncbi:MAG: M1 family aminopeptidase [Proteobacteria bacterium]|nr:M1 family aminopeptidase [Pseudomonadota bacterium]